MRKMFLTGCKQVISNDQTKYDDDDGQETICNKKHDRHTDSEPEQDKSEKTFHTLTPFWWFGKIKLLISYFMHGEKNSYTEAQPNGIIGLCWCLEFCWQKSLF